ncbi:MAG: hypothetical protein GXX91_08425 [Verrucomicrobiaceae bacterium]|nr:hypothetical protein [Verrucomicrobiaceae bacterium]
MKITHTLTALVALIALSGCTTPTRQHMRIANVKLAESEQKMAAGEWTQATALAEEAGAEVKLGIEARPIRKGAGGGDLDMTPLFAAWLNGPHHELVSALGANQAERATAAFAATRQQCANCHIAVGRPTIPVSGL